MTTFSGWRLATLFVFAELAACSATPPINIYVLGDAPHTAAGVSSQDGRPVIEMRTVVVPDYLDSTDILRRTGPNTVVASPTGQWAERLSQGVTDTVAAELSRRLVDRVIVTSPPTAAIRRLTITIERFDIEPTGHCLITARWLIVDPKEHDLAQRAQGTFETQAEGGTDAAVAAAMTRVIDQMADQIAAGLGP